MRVRINEACTEFGRTFTLGQVVSDLPTLEKHAMVQSGFARWLPTTEAQEGAPLNVILPDQGVVPITSRQHANPVLYGLNLFPLRTYQFGSLRVFWSGSAWVNLAA